MTTLQEQPHCALDAPFDASATVIILDICEEEARLWDHLGNIAQEQDA